VGYFWLGARSLVIFHEICCERQEKTEPFARKKLSH
jgi:hypothetical protein